MKRTSKSAKPEHGRPAIYGTKLVGRSLPLPESAWAELDEEAHEKRISTSELIRRKLGIVPAPAKPA